MPSTECFSTSLRPGGAQNHPLRMFHHRYHVNKHFSSLKQKRSRFYILKLNHVQTTLIYRYGLDTTPKLAETCVAGEGDVRGMWGGCDGDVRGIEFGPRLWKRFESPTSKKRDLVILEMARLFKSLSIRCKIITKPRLFLDGLAEMLEQIRSCNQWGGKVFSKGLQDTRAVRYLKPGRSINIKHGAI